MYKMAKIAIDIALIPPKEIISKIEGITKEADKKGQTEHLMNENDFIPHISLSMGCTDKSNIDKISSLITNLSQDFNPIKIKLTNLKHFESSEGKKTYWFSIARNKRLQKLHETMLDKVENFLSYDPTPEMYFRKEGEKVTTISRGIPMFKKRSRENYDPHVTLLVHETNFKDIPLEFEASRLAICQAGVRTSCRKILFEINLSNGKSN